MNFKEGFHRIGLTLACLVSILSISFACNMCNNMDKIGVESILISLLLCFTIGCITFGIVYLIYTAISSLVFWIVDGFKIKI